MGKSRRRGPRRANYELTSCDGRPTNTPRGVDRENKEFRFRLEEGRVNLALRRRVAYFLLGLFALNTVGALVVVFFVGFGLMVVSNTVIISLIGETVAHAAAMFFTVTKYLFPAK